MKNKDRATHADIFERLERLVSPQAGMVIRHVIAQLTAGETEEALETLKEFDTRIGGFSLRDVNGQKLIGIYRPMWYVEFYLCHPQPQHLGRAIINVACGLVEFLLERMVLWGIFHVIQPSRSPMGAMVALIKPHLPKQLGDDLQWLSSRIYNFAKHDYDVNDRNTPEAKGHYFELDEALAVYFIARRLEIDLEKISGKSRAELMAN